MAFYGLGVWALVAQRIVKQGLNSIFLWLWNRWKPLLVLAKSHLKNYLVSEASCLSAD